MAVQTTAASFTPDERSRYAPRRVLLVDTDPGFVSTATDWLTGHGFEVAAASDFAYARSYLQRERPDILISEVRLGAFNGLHLILMSRLERPDLTAIVLNRHDDPVLRDEASHAGARFLVKPVACDALLRELVGSPAPGAG